ncbi:MAG: ABC transporter permease subunit [Thaumarchaeota archaeon]|nr:ABC transporter permease subunit [Nitrososphaerota archaeon]
MAADILSGLSLGGILHVFLYSSYSLLRMAIALVISYAFAISYGVAAARNKRAERILMPVLDILQSVPILGFFPAAIFFFIALFQHSWVGVELAAVFLIFTSQAWNLAFAVYESVSSIPADLEEAAGSFSLKGWRKFRTLYIPASVPKLIYNGILSWSTGWYYLVAAEMISIGSQQFKLQGIGSYLADATYAGNYQGTVLGLIVLVTMILIVDLALWRPLRHYADRFRYESISSEEDGRSPHDQRITWLRSHLAVLPVRPPTALTHAITTTTFRPIAQTVRYAAEEGRIMQRHRKLVIVVASVVAAAVFIVTSEAVIAGLISIPASISNDLRKQEVISAASQIPAALGFSLLRLMVAYLLSIAWILPLALKISGKPRSFGTSVFAMEILASLPATALFPLIVLGTMNLPGGLQLTSIILTMTGMQWYLLFNILGGVKAIPSDLVEVSKTYRITGFQKMRKLIFPAILPSFITGSITAWGGGWNALVLSEYITFNKQTMSVLGIGSLMNRAAYEIGNVSLLMLTIVVMVCVVVGLNRLVWRRLYKITFSKYRLD